MDLTCPACGARYSVDESLIPREGRRVQCSACDHVWHFDPRRAPAEVAARPAAVGPAAHDQEDETPGPARPPLPADVKAILREEADREAKLRGGSSGRGAQGVAVAGPTEQRPGPPRGPMPDPDEINATLRAASTGARVRRGRDGGSGGGFGAGMALGFILVAGAVAVYLAAPQLADAVPAAAEPLATYVAGVDAARVSLDQGADRATEMARSFFSD